jgi:hypothetical protein
MKAFLLALFAGVAMAGDPRPVDDLDREIVKSDNGLLIRCAQLSKVVYVENMACKFCQLDGPLTMVFICVYSQPDAAQSE